MSAPVVIKLHGDVRQVVDALGSVDRRVKRAVLAELLRMVNLECRRLGVDGGPEPVHDPSYEAYRIQRDAARAFDEAAAAMAAGMERIVAALHAEHDVEPRSRWWRSRRSLRSVWRWLWTPRRGCGA